MLPISFLFAVAVVAYGSVLRLLFRLPAFSFLLPIYTTVHLRCLSTLAIYLPGGRPGRPGRLGHLGRLGRLGRFGRFGCRLRRWSFVVSVNVAAFLAKYVVTGVVSFWLFGVCTCMLVLLFLLYFSAYVLYVVFVVFVLYISVHVLYVAADCNDSIFQTVLFSGVSCAG